MPLFISLDHAWADYERQCAANNMRNDLQTKQAFYAGAGVVLDVVGYMGGQVGAGTMTSAQGAALLTKCSAEFKAFLNSL